ncbi:hypothetical protein HFP72_00195 [Nocardiopsis sp. ARC36]
MVSIPRRALAAPGDNPSPLQATGPHRRPVPGAGTAAPAAEPGGVLTEVAAAPAPSEPQDRGAPAGEGAADGAGTGRRTPTWGCHGAGASTWPPQEAPAAAQDTGGQRSLSDIRSMMSAFQSGTLRGRAESEELGEGGARGARPGERSEG